MATYWAARLLTQDWAAPGGGGGGHLLLASSSSTPLVSAYAVRRPDRRIALLLVNKDPATSYALHPSGVRGPFDVYQLSSRDYVWHANGTAGSARPDRPPAHTVASGSVALPPWSLTVLRTR